MLHRLIVLCALLLQGCLPLPQAKRMPPVILGERGPQAPAFDFSSFDGTRHRLSEYAGKVVLVHFWASWCPACLSELYSLNTLQLAFDSDDLVVLAIALDREPRDAVQAVAKRELDLAFFHAPESSAREVFGVKGVPATLVIDRGGQLVYLNDINSGRSLQVAGPRRWNEQQLVDDLENLVEQNF